MDSKIKQRNQKRVELTFRVLDSMEDLREIWRGAAPLQELDEAQTQKAIKKIGKARKALDELENTL